MIVSDRYVRKQTFSFISSNNFTSETYYRGNTTWNVDFFIQKMNVQGAAGQQQFKLRRFKYFISDASKKKLITYLEKKNKNHKTCIII